MIIVTSCMCVDLGDEAAAFVDKIMGSRMLSLALYAQALSAFTGREGNRVVRVLDDSFRYVHDMPVWFGESPSPQDRTCLADYGPLLLTNEASLASINTKIPDDKRCAMASMLLGDCCC